MLVLNCSNMKISGALVRQYAAVIIVNLNIISTGMSLAWPSPVLVKLRNATETPLPSPITDEEGSWIVALGFLFSCITDFIGGFLLDIIGRKYCLFLIAVPKVLMGFLCIFATQPWMIILARTITLVGDCFSFVVAPVYASEIAAKDHRAVLGTFLQMFSCVGAVITLSVGPYTSYRTFNIVYTSLITVFSIPILLLPESPYHLYAEGHTKKALNVLYQIRPSKTVAEEEIEEYRLSNTNKEKIDTLTLYKSKKVYMKSLILCIILSIGIQLSGFNAVFFYLQTILELTKTNVQPEMASVILGLIQIFAGSCTVVISNKFKRKAILNWTLGGMCCGMVGLGAFFKIREQEDGPVIGFMNYLPIMSLILVIYCYSVGIGSLYWLIIAEIFNGPARAFGVSIGAVTSHFFLFFTSKYFSYMTTALGPAGTYWFFATTCAVLAVLLLVLLPETKGKSFNEIEKTFSGEDVKETQ